jgi:hypothetical protein
MSHDFFARSGFNQKYGKHVDLSSERLPDLHQSILASQTPVPHDKYSYHSMLINLLILLL